MDDANKACGCSGNPKFDGVDPAYKRILWVVIAINAIMFIVEMSAGKLAGSQALQADALDFLGDSLTYGLSLAFIGISLRVMNIRVCVANSMLGQFADKRAVCLVLPNEKFGTMRVTV